MQSLLIQGEIIAGAIASSATVDTDTITIDPDKLLQMQAGETDRFNDETLSPLEFSINPERVAPLLRRLVTPTRTRARIYDREGALLLDSRSFYSRGDILRFDLPPVANARTRPASSSAPGTACARCSGAPSGPCSRRSARRTASPCRRCSRPSRASRPASCA